MRAVAHAESGATVAGMDSELAALAQSRGGLLRADEVGGLRAGRRRGLVVVQPRVLLAETQPLEPRTAVTSLTMSLSGDYWFAGRTALWLYGAGPAPAVVEVGVRDTRQVVLRPPVRVRRLAPSLLRATRVVDGRPLVALETAVVQSIELGDDPLVLVESVLRRRLTTQTRLVRRCRRGVAGSSSLRRALDVVSDGDLEDLKRRLRHALVAAGVTGLESEVPLRSAGGAVAYLDLLHRPSRNAVELDGWLTHTERSRFTADRRRDRWVRREHGIVTTRVAADEARADLPALVEELLPLLVPPRG